MDTHTIRYGSKWIVSSLIVPVLALAIYLMSVFGVYILAWILGLIGTIFR